MARVRTIGAGLVAVSLAAIAVLRMLLVAAPTGHQATVGELLLAFVAVVAGLCGMGMLVEGAAIFGEDVGRRRG